jgi:hypothetical protein
MRLGEIISGLHFGEAAHQPFVKRRIEIRLKIIFG